MTRTALAVLFLLSASTAAAKDIYLPVVGSVGVFRTDARIVNPSTAKDITITATFTPAQGQPGAPSTVTITVPKRQQKVYDDVVASLFSQSGLGAIKLSSPDDFVATARIYATGVTGTLGQFEQGVDATAATSRGLIPQLKSTGASGQTGTFRTNVGFVNTTASPANVTLRLYDRNNAVVSTQTITIPAGGVLSPANYFAAATGDFADAWAAYESDRPLIAYGSVVDNGTTDPTFIQAVEDTGNAPSTPTGRVYDITASNWQFTVTPEANMRVREGERVTLRLRSTNGVHGFELPPFVPAVVLNNSVQEVSFVATDPGTYVYYCTVSSCGSGHARMNGTLTITAKDDPAY